MTQVTNTSGGPVPSGMYFGFDEYWDYTNGMYGWSFSLSTTVTVTSLAWFDQDLDGLRHSHEVGIWENSRNPQLIVSTVIPAGNGAVLDGPWRRVDLPSSIILPAGEYVVAGTYYSENQDVVKFVAGDGFPHDPAFSIGVPACSNPLTPPSDPLFQFPNAFMVVTAGVELGPNLFILPTGLNTVGYVNGTYAEGTNLVSNPLASFLNTLNSLFPSPPDQTTISLWDPAAQAFVSSAVFTMDLGWDPDMVLEPGEGALLVTRAPFTNTFSGNILEPDGSPFDDSPWSRLPQPDRPTGTYLLSSKAPINLGGPGYDVFQFVLGRGPQDGEQFTWFDPTSQAYRSTTFTGGKWDNGSPALPVCGSAWFRIYGSPTLTMAHSPQITLLSWPASDADFHLEVSTNLAGGGNWMPLTNSISTNRGVIATTNLSSYGPEVFYRLHR